MAEHQVHAHAYNCINPAPEALLIETGVLSPPDRIALPPLPTDRPTMEAMVQFLIDELDRRDGDPDAEEIDAEDSFALTHLALGTTEGPGCEIGDAGGRVPDEDCPNNRLGFAQGDGPGCTISDPDLAIDDGPCDLDEDREAEDPVFPSYGVDQTNGPEHWTPANDLRASRPHRERIQRARCVPTRWGGFRLVANARTIATDDN